MQEKLVIGDVAQDRVGPVWVALTANGLVGVVMKADEAAARAQLGAHFAHYAVQRDESMTATLCSQLAAYFEGKSRSFDVAIDWRGMGDFQRQVLERVLAIPYGQTRTYQEIALELGQPGAARAVGRANATNPMPIIIPCHRVLGADGGLHGYSGPGGVETKAWLLAMEGSRLL